MPAASELLAERHRLAAELRALREASGLTTRALAERLDVSQGKVSKIETGRTAPSATDVEAWASATGAPEDLAARLAERAERARTEALNWRSVLRRASLPRIQQEVGMIEQLAGVLRAYCPIVPHGLLQTAGYARVIYEVGWPDRRPDIGLAVAARMERQSLLYEPGHRFEFVLAETALRWRIGSVSVQLAQLDRLRTAATLENVFLGVLPLHAQAPAFHDHGFTLFDERADEGEALVHVELLTAGVNVAAPADVEEYRRAFAGLRESSLNGGAAIELISSVMQELEDQP